MKYDVELCGPLFEAIDRREICLIGDTGFLSIEAENEEDAYRKAEDLFNELLEQSAVGFVHIDE